MCGIYGSTIAYKEAEIKAKLERISFRGPDKLDYKIYNSSIKPIIKLAKKGYTFNTTSDTEVICAAYLEYGENCINYFNGMFTFVIYDEKQQQLFGARDRLGQKPFYYYHNKTDFEFGSQLSSIQLFNKNLSISKKAISYYLAWGAVPDPFSIFNEIKKLKAGNTFTYNLVSGKFIESKNKNLFGKV